MEIVNIIMDAFIKGYFTGRTMNGTELNKCFDACIKSYEPTALGKQMKTAAESKRKEVADALWANYKAA